MFEPPQWMRPKSGQPTTPAPASEPGPSYAPTIALPSGGGSLRSLGDKFTTNHFTGAGSLAIPIPTSPARFGPSLSLSHASSLGNGPCGQGWQLMGVPSIARATNKRVPRHLDREPDPKERDTFILAGAEDLVCELDEEGKPWRRRIDAILTERYRPRVEAGFAAIEWRTNIFTGHSVWHVVTADNVTHVFGDSDDAKIIRPQRGHSVSAWLLERSTDDRGNVIVYEYAREDLAGVDPSSPSEAPRLAVTPIQPQRYLAKIRYGNAVPFVADDFRFEVVFDYGGHGTWHGKSLEQLEIGPSPVRPWPVRSDPFSSCRLGFDLRTRRLLRRVLMFHRFPELGEAPYLVSSTDLMHDEQPALTRLVGVTQRSYRRDDSTGHYEVASLPTLEFEYSPAALDPTLHEIDDPITLAHLPRGIEGRQYRLLDLDGEGLPGVVIEQDGKHYYKPGVGAGELGPMVPVPKLPKLLESQVMHLLDVDADGRREAVHFARPLSGFHARQDAQGVGEHPQGNWGGFQAFGPLPAIDWNSPRVQLVDIGGRGFADVLVDLGDRYHWYPSRGTAGFDQPREIIKPDDVTGHRALLRRDAHTLIEFADMTGDGLPDLVRVRNGEVTYWPNLGSWEFGYFGKPIRMPGLVPFASAGDLFDPRRVRLADVDGSGTADLIYLDERGATIFRNLAGNRFASPERLTQFPLFQPLTDWAEVVDLKGEGTACLVWSTGTPAGRGGALRYLDLFGGQKPHLLTRIRNGMGAETRIEHASSTRFYLEDKRAGRPWLTRLPFPVQVVTRVDTIDHVTGEHFVQRFAYHHGHFDGVEREFRGFGMVESWDADAGLAQPPIHTKTWFHTGTWGFASEVASEFWQGDPQAPTLCDALPTPPMRDAVQALAGKVLRSEVYAEDGSAFAGEPFIVHQSTYAARVLQARGINPRAVLLVHDHESLSHHYDRVAGDPRVTHSLVLEVDDFGSVRRSAAVAYPRRVPEQPEQAVLHATLAELDVAHLVSVDEGVRRIGVPVESRSFELLELVPEFGGVLSWEAVHEAASQPPGASKRLLARSRTRYLANDLSGPLPLGVIESRALVHSSETMVMTDAQRLAAFGERPGAPDLSEGGYVLDEGAWWTRSGVPTYDGARFFQVVATADPFGNVYTTLYDPHALLVTASVDPLGNTTSVVHDYRLLAAWQLTDPNGNRSSVAFDVLGFVVRSAIAGKVDEALGDTLDDPTSHFEYDLHTWSKGEGPCWARSRARETHGDPAARWLERRAYFSGTGRIVLTKMQARPGLAPSRDAQGQLVLDEQGELVLADTSPALRWIGSGRTIHDNKGNLVRAYEPYYSSTPGFEAEAELVEQGVTPILQYDALGRLVRTDFPNGTLSKSVLGPWRHASWDSNDCVLESAWYAARSGDPGNDVSQQKEHRAAQITVEHAGTPSLALLDPLGRVVVQVGHSRADGLDVMLETRSVLDVQGRETKVLDARGNVAEERTFDMLGRPLVVTSIDAGPRWLLTDATGQPWHAWDARGHHEIITRDELRRPVDRLVALDQGPLQLRERVVYGERLDTPELTNHRGRVLHVFDGGGLASTPAYDFAGHPTSALRRLPASKTDTLDWSPLLGLDTLEAMTAAAASLLDVETFTASSTHDALGRVLAAVSPDGSVVLYAYDEAGALQRVTMQHRGAALVQTVVGELEYDAKGRRTRVVYGPLDAPTSTTRYTHDELSGRLLRLRTVRGSDDAVLQSLHYHHDPVGNVTDIRDTAQATVYFANAVVEAANSYTYDPLYRLIEATGREHASEGTDQRTHLDLVSTPHPMTSDPSAMRRYTQRYRYDAVGNLLEMRHFPSGGAGWTRRYQVAEQGNRLLATSAPGDAEGQFSHTYQHDAHGNMLAMPHLAALVWDHDDQLAQAVAGAETVSFAYTAGARCRKYTSKPGATSEERIYVGSFELYRKRVDGALVLERESLHVSDDGGRIALIETKTVDEGQALAQPVGVWRLQLSNHLGSAVTEITEAGQVISHEEFHPFGTSAYRAVDTAIDVSPRRYRFTGMERDDETGLALHGARYYASWLGRWTAADPIGLGGGINRFAYCGGNPINLADPSGHAGSLTAGIWERFAGKPDVKIEVEAANYTVEDTVNYLEQHPEDINSFIESQHYEHGYKMLVLDEIERRQDGQDPVTRFQQGVADAQAMQDWAQEGARQFAAAEHARQTQEYVGNGYSATEAGLRQREIVGGQENSFKQLTGIQGAMAEAPMQWYAKAQTPIIGSAMRVLETVAASPDPQDALSANTLESRFRLPWKLGPQNTRLKQDVDVDPIPPPALSLNRPISRSATQNARVQQDIARLQELGATDFRVNQQQVNIHGVRVGTNRPDLQYTLNGKRHYIEYDTPQSGRGPAHRQRILSNDPNGNVILIIQR